MLAIFLAVFNVIADIIIIACLVKMIKNEKAARTDEV